MKIKLHLFPLPASPESPSIESDPRFLFRLDPEAGGAGLGTIPETLPVGAAVVAFAPATGTAGSVKVAGAVVPRTAADAGVGPSVGGNAGLWVVVPASPGEGTTASVVMGAVAGP